MEREVGAQVVSPATFIHPSRFHEVPQPLLGKKRESPWQNTSFNLGHLPGQYPRAVPMLPGANRNWNPKDWDWDRVGFEARSSSVVASGTLSLSTQEVSEDQETLTLKLGGGDYAVGEETAAAAGRPSKRVRSGSPGSGGGGSYPMCQVDDCRADLLGAKDYHRRHKVCEVHSKMTKAIVGKVMQRFCQQCSRFHPLSEFDEGKRSCRRRLAGHNRRRRKTQPEDVSSQLALSGSQEKGVNGSMDIVNLLALLARLQGKNADKQANIPPLPENNHLLQILSKIHPLPAANSLSRSPGSSGIDLNVSQGSFHPPCKVNLNPTAPSTMDLLGVLSAELAASERSNLASPPQVSSDSSGVDKSSQILASHGARSSSCANQSLLGEPSVQEARVRLPLQLFGSSDDGSPPKLASSVKYLSSESSNPMEDRPELFPVNSAAERRYERMSICKEDNLTAEASTSCGWNTQLKLFKGSERLGVNGLVQNRRSHAGYTSSGSDRSPSSSTSDAQDRTDRIIFKLFDKDPSNLPASLRSQILNWLSSSPSEMESYIRPGCVVLSVYASMPSIAWDELEEDLLQRMNLLLQYADTEFWRNGRFLVRTSRQLASHKDGKIRLCKSWRTWSAPELTSVSPVAVVSGKETSIVLRGRNLTVPGTKIHCTYMGGYTSREVLGSTYPGTIYDNSSSETYIFPRGSPDVFGRCFIEVENGFKGNSFPVIIADATICQELRGLEGTLGSSDAITEEQTQEDGRPRSREDVLHFLNELGWLFQKKETPQSPLAVDFCITRFMFLFTFSVEQDWSALVRTLLDILVERSIGSDALSQEALEMLLELQLLSRAVKRKCRKMVDLFLNYSVKRRLDVSKVYLFPPNLAGPGGFTPLHLAASAKDSEDIVDALTNDPQEIGLQCWDSIKDNNGQSPRMYASMTNNHSYNSLVARKLADRKNGQLSIMVRNGDLPLEKMLPVGESRSLQAGSCARCAVMEAGRGRRVIRSRGLLHRPYVHSMLAIAAVCVCVCLILRGMPKICSIEPFKWENLDFGPS